MDVFRSKGRNSYNIMTLEQQLKKNGLWKKATDTLKELNKRDDMFVEFVIEKAKAKPGIIIGWFCFEDTKEGFDYWYSLHEKLKKEQQ